MSWLRWWTGTVNDPKWRIVASRAKCRAGDCVAVWAYLLEIAKDGEGDISNADAEECAVVLGYEVETVEAIIAAMRDKSLLDGNRVASWEKRQPKREDDSRARVAAYRARQAETKIVTEQIVELSNDTVTHGNAPDTESESESESDTEKNISSLRSDTERAQSAAPASPKKSRSRSAGEETLIMHGVRPEVLEDWKAVRKVKKAGPITETVASATIREASKAGLSAHNAVRMAAERGWQGFKAEWAANATRAGPAPRQERTNYFAQEALRLENERTGRTQGYGSSQIDGAIIEADPGY